MSAWRPRGGTALERYARLEAEGRYLDGQTAEPHEVIVKFGQASLTLSTSDDVPLAHWALASLREIDEPGGGDEIRLAPSDEGDERLTLTDKDMIEAIRAVCPDLRARPRAPAALKRALAWSVGAAAALALIVFVLVPMLAERMAPLIPREQAERLGDTVIERIAALVGDDEAAAMCDAPEGRRALDRMERRLTAAAGADAPRVVVRVLDHPMENAFAVPGGRIVLFRGLIAEAASPEEVAGVLAHEMGHVANLDPTREALRAAGSAGIIGMLLGDVAGGTLVVLVTEAVLSASYRQEAESRADDHAHALMGAAGLPSSAMAGFFERMRAAHGDQDSLLSHVASHPGLAEREEKARAADRIGDAPFEPVLTDEEWIALRQICG